MELHKIEIKDIMVTEPFTIGENEPFSRVWEIFSLHRIRHLPVLNENRIIVGIVSQRDLYKTVSPRRTLEGDYFYNKEILDGFVLKRVMNKELACLSPQDTLGSIIKLMVDKKYGCIPIIDKDRVLVGVMTRIDVLRAIKKYFI